MKRKVRVYLEGKKTPGGRSSLMKPNGAFDFKGDLEGELNNQSMGMLGASANTYMM